MAFFVGGDHAAPPDADIWDRSAWAQAAAALTDQFGLTLSPD